MITQRYFEDRVSAGFGFHYDTELQNQYAWNIRRKVLFSNLDIAHKRIIDIGCGDGSWLIEFLKRKAFYVLGIEQGKLLQQNAVRSIKKNHYKIKRGRDYSVSSCPGGSRFWSKYKGARFEVAVMITSYNFMNNGDRNRTLIDLRSNMLRTGGKLCILDYLPNAVPDYQKRLKYKEVSTEWELVNRLKVLGYKNIKVVPISIVDSALFHRFGVNAVTKWITELVDYNFAKYFSKRAKYKLVIAEK